MHCHNFHGVACLEFAMIINHAVCVLKVEQNNTGISLDHLFNALKTIFLPNSSWELDFAVVSFSPDNACSIQNMCKKLPKYL